MKLPSPNLCKMLIFKGKLFFLEFCMKSWVASEGKALLFVKEGGEI